MLKLSYEEFRDYCVKNIVKIMGDDYSAAIETRTKSDEEIYEVISLKKKGMDTGLQFGFQVEPFYSDYLGGMKLGEVMLEIVKMLEKDSNVTLFLDPESFNAFDTIKDKLIIRPINYSKNKNLLMEHVYKRHGDIAAVLYTIMTTDESDKGNVVMGTAKVPKKTVSDWSVPEDYVLNFALANTALLYKPFIAPVELAFSGADFAKNIPDRNKFFMNPLLTFELLPSQVSTYYLSIDKGINGAIAPFYSGVLERLAQIFSDDLYLNFSCMREVIVHPASQIDKKSFIKQALNEAKNPYINPADFLTEKPYVYERRNKELRILS